MSEAEAFPDQFVPEPGQLAEVRRRQWVVTDVVASVPTVSVLPPSGKKSRGEHEVRDAGAAYATQGQTQHWVVLSSIDEDALGEELEVVWEIEPGARVIEKAGLPAIDGQDESRHLQAFLDAVRWGAATNADRSYLQAPFRSGVGIDAFQLDPLVRAIDMARVNLLIADDVGLGKTIEAGLVVQELLLRHRARTVFIVCPASLQTKWRDEMLEKFGLDFQIVDSDYLRTLRRSRGIHANPWTSFPRLIASVDWIKSGEGLRRLKEVLPHRATHPRKFDILIIDEAHNVSPAGSANYAMASQRTRLARMLVPHFQHKLFLTATPHNGYKQSFTSLLEMLDDQRFSRSVDPDPERLDAVMVRRLKSNLTDPKTGKPLYAQRVLRALPIEYTEEEREVHETLHAYCASREKTDEARMGTKFVNELLKKRLFSSPAAFASTLETHLSTLSGGRRKAKKLDERILRKAIQKADEDYADDGKHDAAQQDAVLEASSRAAALTDAEQKMLQGMRSWAQRNRSRSDSKADAIIDWIETHLKTKGDWNERRVILFTEYRDTHSWLQQILATAGYGGDRLLTLHGGMDQKERQPIKDAFQADPALSPVRILLATDAASEGIDLQKYCNYMIHLEIPYNPNVMEQRNGRIDRWGQKYDEVVIWHPVDSGSDKKPVGGHGDDIVRALTKLDAMRADMGSVNPVIAPQLGELIEGRRRDFETGRSNKRTQEARRFTRTPRNIEERIKSLHDRLMETRRELHLEPERVLEAVEVGLALAEKPPLALAELEGAPSGSVFRMPELSGSWARCAEGLEDPFTKVVRPITFDHDVAKDRDDVVLVHLNHPLVQMCLRLLRAEVWAQSDLKKLHRVDVRLVPDKVLSEESVVVVSRLVVMGGDHHRLHEELTMAGGRLDGKAQFRTERGVERIAHWMEKSGDFTANADYFDDLQHRFERAEDRIMRAVDARSNDRVRHLRSSLENRKKREIRNLNRVLDDLEASIREELDRPVQETLLPDERQELRRDEAAMEARLSELPDERAREMAAIEARYGGFTERTFPIAVIFLLPQSKKRVAS